MHPKQALAFLQWQDRMEIVHNEATPRFYHARICYEVKRFSLQSLNQMQPFRSRV